jgi:hypothetical protein
MRHVKKWSLMILIQSEKKAQSIGYLYQQELKIKKCINRIKNYLIDPSVSSHLKKIFKKFQSVCISASFNFF